jgi:UDP-N-acetylmuramyl pentapeptide phosphotransferase/UDP-N-acetylglucosamine-1-phosphate transferase
MNPLPYLEQVLTGNLIYLYLPLVLAYFISHQLFLILVKVSKGKNLQVPIVDRSSHSIWCTNLGGVIIYFVITFSRHLFAALLLETEQTNESLFLSLSILIVFFIGLKDDLIEINPYKKIAGQLLAFAMLILFMDLKIESFGGIFGIQELSSGVSILVSFLAALFIINSFNLIDGIDGLAASIALIINLFFGIYFLFFEDYYHALISISMIGILLSFLQFNFSTTEKIIMGDSGAFVIALLITYQFFTFLSYTDNPAQPLLVGPKILYLIALFSYPIADTTRVFVVRVLARKNPFAPDKNHLHHLLLRNGFTHAQATLLIAFLTLSLVLLAYVVSDLPIALAFSLLTGTLFGFYYLLPRIINLPRILLYRPLEK